MIYVWLIAFILLVLASWLLNFIGMPGNWAIVALALIWFFLGPEKFHFHWAVLIMLVVLAAIGELIEFLASVLGAKNLGGSNRGATLSVIGSIIGGLLGATFGIPFPVPLVGMMIGSILFAGIGAWIGATLGERWGGKPMKESVQIGGAAFIGRLLGTAGKLVMGTTMVILAIAAPFLPLIFD
ncbi:MAG: DUF456 domain-containing protein [Mariniblastus sp.]|nr:DUF456 domain-containing protein [Mariniblastus sp.]